VQTAYQIVAVHELRDYRDEMQHRMSLGALAALLTFPLGAHYEGTKSALVESRCCRIIKRMVSHQILPFNRRSDLQTF
jgi:hypothetical protein